MRELTKEEVKVISGGNPLAFGALQLASAALTGWEIGGAINSFTNSTFGMSTGQAAYYTFNWK